MVLNDKLIGGNWSRPSGNTDLNVMSRALSADLRIGHPSKGATAKNGTSPIRGQEHKSKWPRFGSSREFACWTKSAEP